MKSKLILAVAAVMLGAENGAVFAADSLVAQTGQMDRYAASKGQTAVSGRTAADFSSYYGQDNAQAIAGGLRSGTEIHLVTYAEDSNTIVSEASFTPPTGRMGNGNVYISMALAKQQLVDAGVAQPTAQQIQAAMTGGTITVDSATGPKTYTFQGVLQMRASGMGWGQIAHSLGTKLGPVISGMKSANAALARTPGQPASAGVGATQSRTYAGKSGVVTAGGSGEPNVVDSKGPGGKSGIVTGAGGVAGASSPVGGAKGQGLGAGNVTGGSGGGQGNAYGKGGK